MKRVNTERSPLLATLGVQIEPVILELALTHRSFAYENGGIPTNERLEFLGDSILGQAVTVMLYRTYPNLDEGHLAKRRASLVSTAALAQIARGLGLGDYILLGRGETLTGGRDKASILADTVEALIGATFLDAGGEAATAFVLRLIEPLLAEPGHFGVSMDPKTSLQELAASAGVGVPVYTLEGSGPDHSKVYVATVVIGSAVTAQGVGPSKKFAEMAAARDAIDQLNAL
ncbi:MULTISPECIES: ribonuclease III [Cryobacterium]|uniref:Ribonuclease 3 n=1 Tax=Cryobacterium levicorallinum TaxID=995038 RepID=A0A1I3AD23_9MICO|nr:MULTISPECIES: ribonuclease III [Cryobacterium]TFB86509.1 ribonuclease III [Cryobacterium levicorallinum]TFD60068.1 ribonuclease III [Cryobacterium sp. Hh38]GEP26656.1 ribonuclease 3 [Cryobacterium levicorallinum]SFH47968.1 ribonuclease-3 [Cryobacterium levicorallinum]